MKFHACIHLAVLGDIAFRSNPEHKSFIPKLVNAPCDGMHLGVDRCGNVLCGYTPFRSCCANDLKDPLPNGFYLGFYELECGLTFCCRHLLSFLLDEANIKKLFGTMQEIIKFYLT